MRISDQIHMIILMFIILCITLVTIIIIINGSAHVTIWANFWLYRCYLEKRRSDLLTIITAVIHVHESRRGKENRKEDSLKKESKAELRVNNGKKRRKKTSITILSSDFHV